MQSNTDARDMKTLNETLESTLTWLQDERPDGLRLAELAVFESLTRDLHQKARHHIERMNAERENRRRNLERRALEIHLDQRGGGF